MPLILELLFLTCLLFPPDRNMGVIDHADAADEPESKVVIHSETLAITVDCQPRYLAAGSTAGGEIGKGPEIHIHPRLCALEMIKDLIRQGNAAGFTFFEDGLQAVAHLCAETGDLG